MTVRARRIPRPHIIMKITSPWMTAKHYLRTYMEQLLYNQQPPFFCRAILGPRASGCALILSSRRHYCDALFALHRELVVLQTF